MKFLPFLIAAGVVAGLSALPVRPVIVTGRSMMPTLNNFQITLGSRNVRDLKRGDVVVVDTPEGTSVKRVAFIEGDTFPQYCWQGTWMTPATKQMRTTLEKARATRRDVVIGPGEIFVIGDNKNQSIDSRDYGAVPISQVRLRINDLPDVGMQVPGAHYVGINHTVNSV